MGREGRIWEEGRNGGGAAFGMGRGEGEGGWGG